MSTRETDVLKQGLAFHQSGHIVKAEQCYQRVLATHPRNIDANHLLGVIRAQQGRSQEALRLIETAREQAPNSPFILMSLGNVLNALGRNEEAIAAFDRALSISPRYAEALCNRGKALAALGRHLEALAGYDRAVALNPQLFQAWHNRGNTLLALKRFDEALTSFDHALQIKSAFSEAHAGRGSALFSLQRFGEALTSFNRALAIKSDLVEAHTGRGSTLLKLNRCDEALANFDRALRIKSDLHPDVYADRGNALVILKRFDEAVASYGQALSINPGNFYAYTGLANAALHSCDWAKVAEITRDIERTIGLVLPFVMLSYSDNPRIQYECARSYNVSWVRHRGSPLWRGGPYRHNKIRVAYLSADFRSHPTARLIAGLIESHNRERFEVKAISYGVNDQSPMRARLTAAFDQFHDVCDETDLEIANLLRNSEVDIAVDLQGFTMGGRPEILSRRPAPVQVNYLGYPGTMGTEFIDYVIADPVILPFEASNVYTEKIVYLPDCYQVNDKKREIAAAIPTRSSERLPDSGFVFCCFNNNYKITRELFDVWMRLLKQVTGSVFWLLGDNETAQRNLCREAEARGIAATRLVFAKRIPADQHLARHALADLFLDTLPINAHTTASDALWAGLPLITCLGKTFAGRVAASLLCSIGLDDLVTKSLQDYEEMARRLATDRAELELIKTRLRRNRLSFPLFDTYRFARNIEAAYVRMWEKSEAGLQPESFSVQPNLAALSKLGR
jgi:protein O-GlcNAc transferase